MNDLAYTAGDFLKFGEEIKIEGFICLGLEGNLEIYAGYAWDGPSGPPIDTDSTFKISVSYIQNIIFFPISKDTNLNL